MALSLITRGVLALSIAFAALPAEAQTSVPTTERELIALLKSDASKGEKALACKNLSVYGSTECVPVLAPLLEDEQLASWARIALEVIPGDAPNEALRKAAESLKGRLLIGAINSLGVRRDASAAELLTKRLEDEDTDVAAAAALALGRIGNDAATKALRKELAGGGTRNRSAVAEGCILCAERLLEAKDAPEATKVYDEVRKADVPWQRMLEATRGAILAQGDAGIPLLVECLRSPHKGLFQIGLITAREMSGNAVDKALAGEIEKATPERGALIIAAMADRTSTVDVATLARAAGQGDKTVRLAAIHALGRVGNASSLSTLLQVAGEQDAELTQAAKTALADLPKSIDAEIARLLSGPPGPLQAMLIEVVGTRRIEATPALLKALDSSDKSIRAAALTALGATIPQNQLSVLIGQVVSPKRADDVAAAQLALKTAAVRMPDREACAAELSAAMERAPSATKVVLLDIIAAVGGSKALQTVAASARSNDPQLQDAASRLLGEWSTVDAAPVLLDLAQAGPYQVRALRGYIRIARQFVLPDEQRIDMCKKALEAAKQPAEEKLVLQVLARYPHVEGLKLAVANTSRPELKDDATQAALTIASKLTGRLEEAQQLLSKASLSKVKVEITKAQYGSGETQKDVTELLQKQAGDTQLVVLPKAKYNDAFGGDPAPNAQKQLTVQYRLNGKTGEASFAENALIVLPLPK